MAPRLTLTARFVAALLLVAVILSAAYYYSVHRIIELVESEIRDRSLLPELRLMAEVLARDPDALVRPPAGARLFIARSQGEVEALPTGLQSLIPGAVGELKLDGRHYLAARLDVDSIRVILTEDIEDLESLEDRLADLAWWTIGGGLLAAALAGVLLGGVVKRPVSRLADSVTNLDPALRGQRIDLTSSDPDIGRIGATFDRYLEKLDQFVERERAFTDEASHELRTPLAIVDGATQLLKRQAPTDPQTIQRLGRIERATAQMHSLIDALLYLARSDGGYAREELDLGALLREACEGHRELLAGRDVRLNCEISAEQRIQAPRGMVLSVINNLLSNAIRHTASGKIEVQLSPGTIMIRDTGTGISGADLPHIFALGYRGGESRGSGLGLHLVRRICQQLGWRIEVTSPEVGGTTFLVLFPVP